jgi:MraZ protein
VEDQGLLASQATERLPEAAKLDHPAFGDQFPLHLDAKGRVILPSVFRPAFVNGGRLRPYESECLGLWTEHGFRLFDERLYAKRQSELSGKAPRRSLFSTAAYVVPDSQGRFVIPERLRTAVALTFDVTIVGNLDHLEIWPSHAWDAVSRDGEDMLAMEIATDVGPHPDQLR